MLTQAELAELAGVQRATVNRLEMGTTAARFSTVRKLAAALCVSASALIEGPTGEDSPEVEKEKG